MTTKTVLTSNSVPDEAVAHAQVVILTQHGWHMIAGAQRVHAYDTDKMPLPAVNCPIIDVSTIPEENDDAAKDIIVANTSKAAGVTNLPALVRGLKAMGAKVKRQHEGTDNTLSGSLRDAGYGNDGAM